MKSLSLVCFALTSAFVLHLPACSEDETSSAPATDAGATATDAARKPDAALESGPGSRLPVRCTDAEFDQVAGPGGGDFTSFPGADISFPMDGAVTQYQNRCVKVKVGDDISFQGSFTNHPLEPQGGDSPNPIPETTSGTLITFKVTTAGTFGFQCSRHASSMFGAIRVVP